MSYHHSRIPLSTTAMADLVLTDAGCGDRLLYTLAKLVGTSPKRQVTHTWVAAPLEISVPSLRH